MLLYGSLEHSKLLKFSDISYELFLSYLTICINLTVHVTTCS